jgi:hypothetical protein
MDYFPYLLELYQELLHDLVDKLPLERILQNAGSSYNKNNNEALELVYMLSTHKIMVNHLTKINYVKYLPYLLETTSARRRKNVYMTLKNLSGVDINPHPGCEDSHDEQNLLGSYNCKDLIRNIMDGLDDKCYS